MRPFSCWFYVKVLGLMLGMMTAIQGQSLPDLEQAPRLDRVATGFKFTEGPVVDRQGRVFFTDLPSQRILRYHPRTQKVEIVRERSGGANGLALDAQGRLLMCEGGSRSLTRLDSDGVKVLADRYQENRLNSPNDLCVAADGGIFFTDPRYGKRDDLEQDVEGVYHLSPTGELRRVVDNLRRPNGVALSPDGKTLYVADEANKRLVAFSVQSDGSVQDPRLFAQWKADRSGGPDGIKVTKHGRVLAAGQGGLWIYETDGTPRLFFGLPEKPTNIALGDKAGKVVYVTAGGSLYRLRFK